MAVCWAGKGLGVGSVPQEAALLLSVLFSLSDFVFSFDRILAGGTILDASE
jgi:hypothetical protein